jgi:AraC family transcriptional regulator
MGQPRISRWRGDSTSLRRGASSPEPDDSEIVYRIRRVLVSDRLHLDETVYAANQNVLPHSHSRAILILPLEGRVLHSVGGTARMFAPGDVAFLPVEHVHALRFLDGVARAFSVEFLDESSADALPQHPIHTTDAYLLGTLLRAYRAFATDTAIDTAELRASLVAGLRRVEERHRQLAASSRSRDTEWLESAFRLVYNGATAGVRIAGIANEVGRHPSHLARRFHEVFGEPIVAVRDRVRVEAASRALLSDRGSISAIAAEVGFSDHAHLTRSFRRTMQMTPLDVRRLLGDSALAPSLQRDLDAPGAFLFVRPPIASDVQPAPP